MQVHIAFTKEQIEEIVKKEVARAIQEYRETKFEKDYIALKEKHEALAKM